MEKVQAQVRITGDDRAVGDMDLSEIQLVGNTDELELAAMGKKQVLKRRFGFWGIMGVALTSTITWEGLLVVFLYGLLNGGPAGLIYGFIFCWIGYAAAMASMAELCSAAPTAGGQYHWTYMLAPPKLQKVFSYIAGWQSVIAWQAATASGGYMVATIIQGLLVLNYPDYDFKRWHATLLFFGVLILATVFNTLLAKHLSKIEAGLLIVHICGFIAILVPLVYFAPHGTAEDVFTKFLKLGGYESDGLTFLIGIVAATYAFIGADGPVHLVEECVDATRVVPWCMLGAIAINGTLGFGMLIAVLFCIGNTNNAIDAETTIGFPFIEIFYQAVRNAGGASGMAAFIALASLFATISIFAASSRMMWAFARDRGVPGSRWLGKVEPRTQLPLWSMGLTLLISILLSLINIGSSAAFNAVVSLVVGGFLGSYLLPISLLIYQRITAPHRLRFGPWTLGRWGLPINLFALIWVIIAMVFSFFPTSPNPTLVEMNWSCLLYGGTCLLAILFYVIRGRKVYDGPVIETTLAERIL